MRTRVQGFNTRRVTAARHRRCLAPSWAVATLMLTAGLGGNPCAPAQAMVVVQRDFVDLVARAEQIVVGTVTDITQRPDESGVPFTFVTFSDLEVLKGDVGSTLTLRFYGGPANGSMMSIPDMPTFTTGERAVLFVAGNGRDVCPLVVVWQGRFRVHFDGARQTDVVESHDGQSVTGLAGRELRYAPSSVTATSPAVTLDEFRQMIRDELAHPHAGAEPAAPQ